VQIQSDDLPFRHLDFLVNQTEKLSSALAEDIQGAVPLRANPFEEDIAEPDSRLLEDPVAETTELKIVESMFLP
jgi:hypothetical protein